MFSICTAKKFTANFWYLRCNNLSEIVECQKNAPNWSKFAELLQSFLLFNTLIKNHVVKSETKIHLIPISMAIWAVSFGVFLVLFVMQPRNKKISFTMAKNVKDSNHIQKGFWCPIVFVLFLSLFCRYYTAKTFQVHWLQKWKWCRLIGPILIRNHAPICRKLCVETKRIEKREREAQEQSLNPLLCWPMGM